jgi:hypothetical protein
VSAGAATNAGKLGARVASGTYAPGAPSDPDVPNQGIRLFEVRDSLGGSLRFSA